VEDEEQGSGSRSSRSTVDPGRWRSRGDDEQETKTGGLAVLSARASTSRPVESVRKVGRRRRILTGQGSGQGIGQGRPQRDEGDKGLKTRFMRGWTVGSS
jgi:hypothetical protein